MSALNNARICIFANGKTQDHVGKRIMAAMRKVAGESNKLEFIGYGGKLMEEQGMKSQFDVGQINDKMFHIYRKIYPHKGHDFLRYHFSALYNKHWNNHVGDIFKLINKANILENMYLERPSIFLSLENENLTWKMMDKLNTFYVNSSLPMPKKLFYYPFINHYRIWHEDKLDYIYHTIPWETMMESYRFQGEYIGQYGVYEAIRELYGKQSSTFGLVQPESIYVIKKNFPTVMEKIVSNVRANYRKRMDIPEDGVTIFFSPGNEVSEAAFCLDECRTGVEEFIRKYSAPTSLEPRALPGTHFTTILSIQKDSGSADYIKDYVKSKGWPGRLIVQEGSGTEHLDAMCASDYGIMYDGQLVGQACICHLPTMTLINMRRRHHFYHHLHNRWWNRMILISETDIYPELIGSQSWYGKICDTLGEWYLNPVIRINMMRSWGPFIKEAMCYVPVDHTVVKKRDLVLADGNVYDEFADPMMRLARHALGVAETYSRDLEAKTYLNPAAMQQPR